VSKLIDGGVTCRYEGQTGVLATQSQYARHYVGSRTTVRVLRVSLSLRASARSGDSAHVDRRDPEPGASGRGPASDEGRETSRGCRHWLLRRCKLSPAAMRPGSFLDWPGRRPAILPVPQMLFSDVCTCGPVSPNRILIYPRLCWPWVRRRSPGRSWKPAGPLILDTCKPARR
jgi:hypothetical protein